MLSLCLALPTAALPLATTVAPPVVLSDGGTAVVRAGHITGPDGADLPGDTLVIEGGRIVSIGMADELAVPFGAQVVDYGPDAVISPGFIAASSPLALGPGAERTAEPDLSAIESFDFFASYASEIASGVTSVYITPARGRLIAGQGAVVKLAGEDPARRVLATTATVHGSISSDARSVPGYWEPPIPATVDVGLGLEQEQYPKSTMGALWALDELLTAAREGREAPDFGPWAAAGLAPLLEAGVPLRLRAETATEVRALSRWAAERKLDVIIEGANGAGAVASELARNKQAVIVEMPFRPNTDLRDLGKGSSAAWPETDTVELLAAAGVRVAVSSEGSPRHLRFAAISSLGGAWGREEALSGITSVPAELLGVADRVGSLAPGMDADLAVFNGNPMDPGSSVLATWIDGEEVWTNSAGKSDAVVISVDELHVGDGTVISPGQMLLRNGRIAELGRRVSRPGGARMVRGAAAMPGIIDTLGYLGLEGSAKVPGADFALSRIVEPGDFTDRRVAKAGVTTVVLSPRKASGSGAPMMAYRPAASSVDHLVIADPTALRLDWRDRNRSNAGKDVRDLLEKAVAYDKEWKEYDAAMAAWTPPPPEPTKASEEEEEEGDEGAEEPKKDDDEGDKDKKDKKKKKKGKDKDKEEDPFPVTGIWTASVVRPPATTESRLRMQLRNTDGVVEGFLRCSAVSETLVPVAGTWAEELAVSGLGSGGPFTLRGTIEDGTLTGTLHIGGGDLELVAKRESREYPFVDRPARTKPEKVDSPKPPKGMPKEPKLDARMEPLRAALRGELALVVEVDREDEILACVDAFEAAGLKPVLFGAEDVQYVMEEIRGRVAGVLLSAQVTEMKAKTGTQVRNRYAELQAAGIPVAFHSEAEEGAAQLRMLAAFAVSEGMSPEGALRALTSDAADMMALSDHIGRLAVGMDADVLVLDASPLEPGSSVLKVFVAGEEVH